LTVSATLSCNVGGVGAASEEKKDGKWVGKRCRGMRMAKNRAPREWVWILTVLIDLVDGM